MPTLKEVEANIGIVEEEKAPHFNEKTWKNALYQMIEMGIKAIIEEEQHKKYQTYK